MNSPQQPYNPHNVPSPAPHAHSPGAPHGGPWPAAGAVHQAPAPTQEPSRFPNMGFSTGSGGVRLHYQGGAFDPANLMAAVTTGKGFDKPRTFGLGLLGIAAVFTVANWAMVMVLNWYYPYLYSLAAIFGMSALWLVATGQPLAQPDGSKAPSWGRWGLGVCLALGVLMGIAMVTMSWERMI